MTEANSINAATAGIVGNTGTSFTGTAVTAHNVIVGGSTSSTLVNVAPSTSGFVLTSNGASADPSFQIPAAGMNKIKTLTASSSASLAFTSAEITATYTSYYILFNNILPQTGSTTFNMDWSVNNGSGYLNSNFQSGSNHHGWNSTTYTNTSSTSTCPITGSNSSTTIPMSGYILICAVGTSTLTNYVGHVFESFNTSYDNFGGQGVGVSVNNIKFSFSSGAIASGTITLYGMVQ